MVHFVPPFSYFLGHGHSYPSISHHCTFFLRASVTAANAAPARGPLTAPPVFFCFSPHRHFSSSHLVLQFLICDSFSSLFTLALSLSLSLSFSPSPPLSARMACVSDESWVSLPTMVSGRLPLSGQQLQEKEDKPKRFDLFSSAYRLERVFPVYALGIPNPDTDSVLASSVHNSDGADPIWDAVKEEAKLEAEKEPILSSFLYASILSHDCLEQALAFVLANRLQNPTLLATQLTDIFSDVMMHDKGIQRSIRLDVQAFKDRDPACLSYCSALLYMKGYHSLQVYRVAHALWGQGRKVLAAALQSRVSEVFGIDIHPAAKIGEGILLDHGTGVVIGETAIVGNRVSLMHGVTLGGTGKELGDRHPKVGEGALIGASVTILGNIRIGEGAMIAAGSLVLKEIPPHSMVAGIPANVIGHLHEHDPSLTMKHDATKDFFKHVAANFRDGKSTGAQDSDRDDVNT